MTHSAPAIRCRGLTRIFRDFWLRPRVIAVADLDLEIGPGQVFGLLGPNGSGKTTTIKMLLGLLSLTRGKIEVLGRPPTDVAVKRRIGYLPEDSTLYPFLTARETLDFFARLFRLDRATRARRIDTLLALVGLEGAQERRVGEYSRGMQRRLGLAQALVGGPDLLILDEPTAGLDPMGTRQIKDLILDLKQRGTTVLLSSHLLADVEDVCDRIAILYGGKLQAEGSVGELLEDLDRQVIECDRLPPDAVERIRCLVEESGRSVHSVTAPRQKLESFFLGIVERARKEGAQTSGSTAEMPVAELRESGSLLSESVDRSRAMDEIAGPAPAAKPCAD